MQPRIPHTTNTLPNGLKVFVHEDARTPIVCVNLWYFVGSKNERPGRTGFAHLFEHLMFEGSKHVPKGQFDELLENAGGTNNGSTTTDRTNYWETLPSSALELALHLESDRMGWFLETITQQNLDAQRDVVKNERRQSYENRPYGLAFETMMGALYPSDHPYHWPVIGWLPDLDAATIDDVRAFFQMYYAPNNASLAIAGDVQTGEVLDLVAKYFDGIPAAAPPPQTIVPALPQQNDAVITLYDDVHLPRLYMAWHSPALLHPGDAEMDAAGDIIGAGKGARLYKTLVHELEIAQDVEAYQNSSELDSTWSVVVTAREGISLEQIEEATRKILDAAVTTIEEPELERARNHITTSTIDSLQSVGGFGGKADRLNHYHYYAHNSDYLAQDLARYDAITVESVRAQLAAVLAAPCVTVNVLPEGGT